MNKQINKEFKNLKDSVKPRSEWVDSNKVLLLSQIKSSAKEKVSFVDYFNAFIGSFRNYLLEPAVVMILLLATFLGSSLTINAAFYSLPGDSLYNVKLTLEKTHVALIQDDERRVELKMEFAQKRISEFDKIFAQADITPEEKKKQIEAIVRELRSNVASVSSDLRRIKAEDRSDQKDERDDQVRMAVTVGSQSEELAKEIGEKINQLSEEDRQQFQLMVSEAVTSVNEVSQSAQELAAEDSADEETQDATAEEDTAEEDIILEESTDETQAAEEKDNDNTQASEDDISDDTATGTEETLE